MTKTMENKIEIPVNGTFEFDGIEYRAIEDRKNTGCEKCDFYDERETSVCALSEISPCSHSSREDDTNIVFKRVNKEENKQENGKSYFKDIVHFLADAGFVIYGYYPEFQEFGKPFNNSMMVFNIIREGHIDQEILYDRGGKPCLFERCHIADIYSSQWREKLISATKKNLRAVLNIQTNMEIEKLFNK